jgi:hypothetical protein
VTYTTQTDRLLDLLRVRPHNGLELRTEHGIGAPNSRRSDLEDRGHVVVCERVKGARGPAAYVYKLLVDAERKTAPLEEPVEGTPAPSASSSSDASSLTTTAADETTGTRPAEGERIPPSAGPEPLFIEREAEHVAPRELYG